MSLNPHCQKHPSVLELRHGDAVGKTYLVSIDFVNFIQRTPEKDIGGWIILK
jgi:hypothetical protein